MEGQNETKNWPPLRKREFYQSEGLWTWTTSQLCCPTHAGFANLHNHWSQFFKINHSLYTHTHILLILFLLRTLIQFSLAAIFCWLLFDPVFFSSLDFYWIILALLLFSLMTHWRSHLFAGQRSQSHKWWTQR